MNMKAISLWQPWASLIREGKKTIETRRWYTHFRGDLVICSTKNPPVAGRLCGYALCIVQVTGCRLMRKEDEPLALCSWEPGRWAWLLRDIRPIEPFPVHGRQGFFDLDASLIFRESAQGLPLFSTRSASSAVKED